LAAHSSTSVSQFGPVYVVEEQSHSYDLDIVIHPSAASHLTMDKNIF